MEMENVVLLATLLNNSKNNWPILNWSIYSDDDFILL